MVVKKEKLLEAIDKFKKKKILIIGDIMLDKYIVGNVSRISPEAPVQIVKVNKENYLPGGAGNVANNIAALGSKTRIIGIVGNDIAAGILDHELKKRDIEPLLVASKNRPTIQKMRVIAQGQQLLRIDYEEGRELEKGIETKVLDLIKEKAEGADIIVVSDYAKGIITKGIMEKIIKYKKNIPVLVDPKPKNKGLYAGATLITPNYSEASSMCGDIEEDGGDILLNIGAKLVKELDSNILITRGERGMSLFEMKNHKVGNITNMPTKAKEVYDVTGAGDTVIGTLAAALAAGSSLEEAMVLANHAAGVVVGKVGTATCSAYELKEDLMGL